MQDYRVAYVFGVYPLQQLLLPIYNDRLNALSIAWDARNASEGGQRWYHIYEGQEPVTSESPLHWTGVYHNWNSRCAECHSTNVVKGYDGERRQYTTTYDQIDVGCEACHGPGSRHIELAAAGKVIATKVLQRWDSHSHLLLEANGVEHPKTISRIASPH